MTARKPQSTNTACDAVATCGVTFDGDSNEHDAHLMRTSSELQNELERVSRLGLRYGLVIVIAWIGSMKFTTYEAEGISGFVTNSPLLRWMYGMVSPRQFSAGLGLVELTIALLIAVGTYLPKLGIIGSIGAITMFATTLSFMFTTPGVAEATAGGFPAISTMPGQFLIKDVVLLAVSIWLLATAIRSVNAATCA